MTLSEIFQDSAIRDQLTVFSDAEKDAIEQSLFEKGGKTHIKCLIRGKEVQAKKEEVVRQLWLKRLLGHYGYSRDRLSCGAYDFRCQPDQLFAGVSETIYLMRCCYFHGELVPSREASACYEPAYHIVRRFLQAIS